MFSYQVKNKRLAKYLYSLGFDRTIQYKNNIELWLFDDTDNFREALDFYFYMRNKNRNQ